MEQLPPSPLWTSPPSSRNGATRLRSLQYWDGVDHDAVATARCSIFSCRDASSHYSFSQRSKRALVHVVNLHSSHIARTPRANMATKKDMRRPELAVPYVEPPAKASDASDISSTMSNTMPMAAMFSRNKMIAWAAVTFSLQNWMAETPEQQKKSATPAYMGVIMAFLSVIVTYMPMFLPTPGNPAPKAAAPPPMPSS
ncbi:hypothetical protein BDBG_06648 [Blastomyces gilchristii SLH14081]|uniref:Protein Asterix n=1 Tax=Blastomyces gilchristii (strain SLH14081) TaxID=559298 RepID=A0A179UUN6_BLAGS|nr:uncharacterized protein BDBG_06648 [Blastomyces gilchristii SLH14081]OAT10868.1 hypothetical protein BDBG_06648 [Blastomyces gilchristii SLH14081]